MREILQNFANVSKDDILGMRAPHLKPGYNTQFEVRSGSNMKCTNTLIFILIYSRYSQIMATYGTPQLLSHRSKYRYGLTHWTTPFRMNVALALAQRDLSQVCPTTTVSCFSSSFQGRINRHVDNGVNRSGCRGRGKI